MGYSQITDHFLNPMTHNFFLLGSYSRFALYWWFHTTFGQAFDAQRLLFEEKGLCWVTMANMLILHRTPYLRSSNKSDTLAIILAQVEKKDPEAGDILSQGHLLLCGTQGLQKDLLEGP